MVHFVLIMLQSDRGVGRAKAPAPAFNSAKLLRAVPADWAGGGQRRVVCFMSRPSDPPFARPTQNPPDRNTL